MDGNHLPAVRVPTMPTGGGEDGEETEETPIVDLPSSEKFGFAWPDKSMSGTPLSPPSLPVNEPDTSEVETSESESLASRDSTHSNGLKESPEQTTPTNESPASSSGSQPPPTIPRLSRAFSMPLPAQLGHLKNPHRSPLSTPLNTLSLPSSPRPLSSPRFQELSLELADSVQTVIQTLLQIAPPHLLDPAKEQFSACSLSVPSPSISAMLTAMKNLNYMSANMAALAGEGEQASGSWPASLYQEEITAPQDDFDIGEMLQSMGDSLSGLAAQAGVDLVLFHADVGMKHVSVRGDECGISSALSHVRALILFRSFD